HFDLYIDSLMRAQVDAASKASKAFEFSERARARTLLDSISEIRVSIKEGVDPVLVQRETTLRAEIDAKSERYTQLLSVDSASKELVNLNDQIRKLEADYDELQGQLKIR